MRKRKRKRRKGKKRKNRTVIVGDFTDSLVGAGQIPCNSGIPKLENHVDIGGVSPRALHWTWIFCGEHPAASTLRLDSPQYYMTQHLVCGM